MIFCHKYFQAIVMGGSDQTLILILSVLISISTFIAILLVSYRLMKKKKCKKISSSEGNKYSKISPTKPSKTKSVPLMLIMKGNVPPPPIEEFEKLRCYDNDLGQRFTIAQGLRYNREECLNLVPANLPFDHNRIKLKRPINGCDYINASWLTPPSDDDDTYDQLIYTTYLPFKRIQFSVGQEPMPNTVDHYFRMIHEQKYDFAVSNTKEPREVPLKANEVFHLHELTLRILKTTTISKNLHRSEISLFNTNESGDQYKHYFTYFEFDAWPIGENSDPEAIEVIVSALCLIRNEMTLKTSSLKVLVTDTRGGVGASAVFLSMYEIMQELDESLTEDDQLKALSNPEIDVFGIVNRLRKDRDKMIEDYETFKVLFRCLNYYGSKRKVFKQVKLNKTRMASFESNATTNSRLSDDGHHKYQNIEEMSEYL